MKAKLLRQAYCLAIAGFEDARCAHRNGTSPQVYTMRIHIEVGRWMERNLAGRITTDERGLPGETERRLTPGTAEASARWRFRPPARRCSTAPGFRLQPAWPGCVRGAIESHRRPAHRAWPR